MKSLKRVEFWLLVGTLVLAAFLRLYRLDTIPPGLYRDEAVDGNNALEAWRSGAFRVFYPENNGREGLVINIQALTLGLSGRNEPWALRLPNALFGVFTVLGVYCLAAQWVARGPALLAAFLMATSFWHIDVSRLGTRTIAAPFFLVWALVLLNASFEAYTIDRHRSRFTAIVSGFVYGLGFHSYPAYRVTPFLLIAVFGFGIRTWGRKPVLAIGTRFALMAVLAALPLIIYGSFYPGAFVQRTEQLSVFHSAHAGLDLLRNGIKTGLMFFVSGDTNWRHNIAGRPMLFWQVAILFFIGITVARRNRGCLLWWLVVGALPAVFANEGVPNALRAILMAPAVSIIAAVGGGSLYDWLKKVASIWTLHTLTGVFCVILTVDVYRSYFLAWARHPDVALSFDQPLVDMAHRLNALPAQMPKFVVVDRDLFFVQGIPLAAQSVVFLTDTFSPERQRQKNLHYILPDETNQICCGDVYVDYIRLAHP